MKYYINKNDVKPTAGEGHYSFELLDRENGCVAGCCTGVSVYTETGYINPKAHEDQEGFFVFEGSGWAMVGSDEFRIEPEVSFIAPAGVMHSIRRDPDSVPVKVFWFHAAI